MRFQLLRPSTVSEAVLWQWAQDASAETRTRLLSFRRPEARIRSLCADHLARVMLAECCAIAPAALTFAREKNGKPYAVGVPFFFNISHSGDFVVCAVDSQPVGVDIETLRPIRPALAKHVCTPEELAYAAPSGQLDTARFLQVWTAKEAFLKRSGRSVFCDLSAISVVQGGKLCIPALRLDTHCTPDYSLSIVSSPEARAADEFRGEMPVISQIERTLQPRTQ